MFFSIVYLLLKQIPIYFGCFWERCNAGLSWSSRNVGKLETSPNFLSARGWMDNDFIFIFGWAVALGCDHASIVLTEEGKVNVDIISVHFQREDGLAFPECNLRQSSTATHSYSDASLQICFRSMKYSAPVGFMGFRPLRKWRLWATWFHCDVYKQLQPVASLTLNLPYLPVQRLSV